MNANTPTTPPTVHPNGEPGSYWPPVASPKKSHTKRNILAIIAGAGLIVVGLAAMLVLTMSALGTAHSQTAAANASLGRANSSLGAARASNASLHGQLASSQAQLAAQQGKEVVGTWTQPDGSTPLTWVFNADHTMTVTVKGNSSMPGTWGIGSGTLITDVPVTVPASVNANAIAETAKISFSGNTMTETFPDGSVWVLTRS
jgi:hypothetical protein